MADEREDRTMKQTEIGMIPDDWEVKELGKISFVTKLAGFEFTAHVKYSDQGTIIALRGLNVRQGVLELKDVKYIDNSNFSKLNRSKLYKNDLLFTYVGTVGNVALVDKNDSYYLAPNVALIRNTRQTDSQYIMYLLLSTNFFNSQIKTLMSTTSQAALSMTNIRLFKIPLPPTLAEQQKIAKALSDVDNVISTLEKLITKKKNLKQGTMQQLLTGKKRLPGFAKSDKFKQTEIGEIPEDWEVKTFEELFEMKAGGDVDKNHFSDSKTHLYKYKIFSNGLENEGLYGYTNLPKYAGDSITITGRGTVGVAMYRKDDFDAVIRLLVLSSKDKIKTDNRFITEQVNSYIKFPNESTGVPQLTVPQIKKINLYLPSKPEQTAIANVLSSIDKEIEGLEAKLGKYRNLKTGMMQQLLTGKIRLM